MAHPNEPGLQALYDIKQALSLFPGNDPFKEKKLKALNSQIKRREKEEDDLKAQDEAKKAPQKPQEAPKAEGEAKTAQPRSEKFKSKYAKKQAVK